MLAPYLQSLERYRTNESLVTQQNKETLPKIITTIYRPTVVTLTRDIDIAILSVRSSVRLSVCPSVTFRYWMKTD